MRTSRRAPPAGSSDVTAGRWSAGRARDHSTTRRTSATAKVRRNAALDDRIAGELRVDVGVIHREMQPATLAPARGALDDELGDGRDVAELEQVPGDEVPPVVLGDLFLKERDTPRGAPEARVGADDADVVPHQPPQLVPVLRDDHRFLARH